MKKTIISLLLLLVFALTAAAQGKRHFDPAKFKAEMEQFITVEACLTPSEAAALFPLYDEMKKEMRTLFNKVRKLKQIKPADEKGCKDAVAQMDQLELEMKQLQMNYLKYSRISLKTPSMENNKKKENSLISYPNSMSTIWFSASFDSGTPG